MGCSLWGSSDETDPGCWWGGLLVGGGIGLIVGAAIVHLPEDGSGQRAYSVVLSMLLAIAGVNRSGGVVGRATRPTARDSVRKRELNSPTVFQFFFAR